jgi:hypothetical protein
MIATELPGRSALQVKNRWNWLNRHDATRENSEMPKDDPLFDGIEFRQARMILEPISIDDSLFGAPFREFQTKMFLH